MKLSIFIDKEREEEVIVYAHEKNSTVKRIEELVCDERPEILGFREDTVEKLDISEIYCFTVENNKVFAYTERNVWHIKQRLYMLEEVLPDNFLKLNQSCIANMNMVKRFEAAFSGSLRVIFKNGHTDFVSRRNMKNIKERLGL